jgi:hypothetical protein
MFQSGTSVERFTFRAANMDFIADDSVVTTIPSGLFDMNLFPTVPVKLSFHVANVRIRKSKCTSNALDLSSSSSNELIDVLLGERFASDRGNVESRDVMASFFASGLV